MELKCGLWGFCFSLLGCFNCTFMELKFSVEDIMDVKSICFNCTFMELKFSWSVIPQELLRF